MRAVVITGGQVNDYAYLQKCLRAHDFVIAADGGYHHARALGLVPDRLLGDFDSIGDLPEGIVCERFPAEKDKTDTELALDLVEELGFDEILILGAIGTRMDHTLANIFLLQGLYQRGIRASIVDEHNQIFFVDREIDLQCEAGQLVSLLPLTHCQGVTTDGLRYALKGVNLEFGKSIGVSNEALAARVQIRLQAGAMLVLLCCD